MTVRRLTVTPVSANIRRDAAAMPGRTGTVSLATLRETRAMLGNVRKKWGPVFRPTLRKTSETGV
jgi:hypothetical protein